MSKDEAVKVWGPLTRSLRHLFDKYKDEKDRIPIARIRPAFNELDLYPSKSQVYEMVLCAVEYGSPCEPDHITYGEFCVLASELQTYYSLDQPVQEPYSLIRRRKDTFAGKRKQRVFLGGSCNPTTWRANIAIPYFKDHGITFYNPQVQNWKPELMELEAQAKQMADVLFFVIDNETRAISSMIEVAYLVATNRQIVVVMEELESQCHVSGETLSNSELSDHFRGRLILTDLIERNSVPIFPDIKNALKCTKLLVTKNIRVQDLTLKDGAQPVRHGHLKLGEAVLHLREVFNSVDSKKDVSLSAQDVCLAYKCCTGEELDASWLRARQKTSDKFLFEEFCSVVTEYRNEQSRLSLLRRIFSVIASPFKWLVLKFSTTPRVSVSQDVREGMRDVYMGGSCGDSHWREEVVEPVLRKNGLSYVTVNPSVNHWHQKVIPIHVSSREQCRLLLYVITKETRALSSMVEAGYYIGKGCRMVLCVEKLRIDVRISGENLSEGSICDYNRGRCYLSDLANREGVPLFDNVHEALACAVTMAVEIHNKEKFQ